MAKLINKNTQQIIAKDIIMSRFILSRIKGLIGTKNLNTNTAFWILPCFGIHTFFMSFVIDVIFVSRKLQVTHIVKNIPPNKFIYPPMFSKTYSVFEFKTPALKNISLQKGDYLHVDN